MPAMNLKMSVCIILKTVNQCAFIHGDKFRISMSFEDLCSYNSVFPHRTKCLLMKRWILQRKSFFSVLRCGFLSLHMYFYN